MTVDRDRDVWDELVEGGLSAEDEAVLRALAEEEGGDTHDHLQAFSPLDEQARGRITDRLVQQVDKDRSRARQRFMGWGGAALAAAAAVWLVVVPGPDVTLPSYELQLVGGLRAERGAEPRVELPRFDRETPWELRLRPTAASADPPSVAVYLVQGERIVPVDVQFDVAESGAMRVRGTAGSLLPFEPGLWDVAVVFGAPLPDSSTQRRWVAASDPRVLRASFELVK